jgi:hypothetical protein
MSSFPRDRGLTPLSSLWRITVAGKPLYTSSTSMDGSMQSEESAHEQADSKNSDAEFLGWQEKKSGEPFAFYNITAADHPSFGSTVTEGSLKRLGLQIPAAPLQSAFTRNTSPLEEGQTR